MWSTVDLQEIRSFLTLAEERHFGRTAERLQLSSSRVSQILRRLETKLGAQLFHRTSRRVELTDRGERFRDEIAGPHGQLITVLQQIYEESAELVGALRVGRLTPDVDGPHCRRSRASFSSAFPNAPSS